MTFPVPIEAPAPVLPFAAALLLAPIALGLLLGLALRSAQPSPKLRGLLAAAPLLAAVWAPPTLFSIGYWDIVLAAILAGLGLAVGSRPRGPLQPGTRKWLLRLAIGAAVLELLCIVKSPAWIPQAGMTTEPLAQRFWQTQDPQNWQMLYPEQFATNLNKIGILAQRAEGEKRPRVLHVGSTMLIQSAWDVDAQRYFPHQLERLLPATQHVDAGTSATGADFHLAAVRALAGRVDADLVVLYVLSRDLWMLGRSYAFCGLEPVLRSPSAALESRCPQPAQQWQLSSRLVAPPPFALRLAMPYVRCAQTAVQLWLKLLPQYPFVNRNDPDDVMARNGAAFTRTLDEVARHLRQAGIPLLVVVLPDQQALQGDAGRQRLQQWLLTQTRTQMARAQVPVLSAIDPFVAVVAKDGTAPWFAGTGYFSARGHDLMATWLGPQLAGRLKARP